jgi:hypothetical protein
MIGCIWGSGFRCRVLFYIGSYSMFCLSRLVRSRFNHWTLVLSRFCRWIKASALHACMSKCKCIHICSVPFILSLTISLPFFRDYFWFLYTKCVIFTLISVNLICQFSRHHVFREDKFSVIFGLFAVNSRNLSRSRPILYYAPVCTVLKYFYSPVFKLKLMYHIYCPLLNISAPSRKSFIFFPLPTL